MIYESSVYKDTLMTGACKMCIYQKVFRRDTFLSDMHDLFGRHCLFH